MTVASSNLVDSFVSELLDLQRIRLERITFSILRHLGNDLAAVSQLPHFTRAPGIQVSFLIIVDLVLIQEKFMLIFDIVLVKLLNYCRIQLYWLWM